MDFFAWEVSWGKILTLDQLKRKVWSITNKRFLCCVEKESIDHILIYCIKVRVLWELLFTLFGVIWVLSFSIRESLLSWLGCFVGEKHIKVWMTTLLCVFWSVWKKQDCF